MVWRFLLMVLVSLLAVITGMAVVFRETIGSSQISTFPPPVVTSIPTVEKLQPLAELVSLRVQIVDILTVEQPGWLHGYQGAWLIQGDALWTTDLQQAQIEVVSSVPGSAAVRIVLPSPRVSWARLDQSKTQTYDLRSTSWIPLLQVPPQVQDEALERAQTLIAEIANQEAYRQQAQHQAEAILTRFYAGYGVVTEIVWLPTDSNAQTDPASP